MQKYNVFLNNRKFILCEYLPKRVSERSLCYTYEGSEKLSKLITFFEKNDFIERCYLVHEDLSRLRNVFFSQFTYIEAAGGFIENRNGSVLFIYRREKWDLPKGKIDSGESPCEAALREVTEETGLFQLEVKTELPSTYHIYKLNDKLMLKRTYWFKMQFIGEELPFPQQDEDITKVTWFSPFQFDIVKANTFASVKQLLKSAANLNSVD